ncbi:hypothetical protein PTTG_30976, partial [Puccinia triticina 1-1 BBBD Race 1]
MILSKALKAQEEGDEEKADRLLAMWDKIAGKTEAKGGSREAHDSSKEPNQIIPLKRPAQDQIDTQVGLTKFVWGVSNSHDNRGFTPYFHKLILELKGPLPFTIFNKEWQEKALTYQSLNRPKTEETAAEKGLRYHGYPVPDEWRQTFIDWTLNHASARETLGIKYKYHTLAEWLRIHKGHCEKLMKRHGFMVGLWYDIRIRNNTF